MARCAAGAGEEQEESGGRSEWCEEMRRTSRSSRRTSPSLVRERRRQPSCLLLYPPDCKSLWHWPDLGPRAYGHDGGQAPGAARVTSGKRPRRATSGRLLPLRHPERRTEWTRVVPPGPRAMRLVAEERPLLLARPGARTTRLVSSRLAPLYSCNGRAAITINQYSRRGGQNSTLG